MPPLDPAAIVRGQYDGYRDEEGVDPHSEVDTYVALRAEIDSWRWAGVPFYVRTGKRLATTATRCWSSSSSHRDFSSLARKPRSPHPNHLLFRLKRRPGTARWRRPTPACSTARSTATSGCSPAPTASRRPGASSAPPLESPPPVELYPSGSWGPGAAEDLIAGHGGWHCPELRTDG
ncbi:MAG: hypothetical protein ABR540_18055 [Acidimicrobiales bacterium]